VVVGVGRSRGSGLAMEKLSPQELEQPSKQQRPKSGQSPSGCPGDQQVDTESSQEEGGRGSTGGQEEGASPAPSPANSPRFFE